MKKTIVLFAFILFAIAVRAQNYVTVTAANIKNGATPVGIGTLCFTATDNQDVLLPGFKAGDGNQIVKPICGHIVSGAVTMASQVPNGDLTTPTHVCYRVTVTTSSNPNVPLLYYKCVQTASNSPAANPWCVSGTCNFDNYNPSVGPNFPMYAGPPGPQGPPGPTGSALTPGTPPQIPSYGTTTTLVSDPRLSFPPQTAKSVKNPSSVSLPGGYREYLGWLHAPFWPSRANVCKAYYDLTTGVMRGLTSTGAPCLGTVTVPCSIVAKNETGADASLLSCTPAAIAGRYNVCVAFDVSAANTATFGWTLTWTNTNGTAIAPTNMALFQIGVAAPALTFSAAASNSYYACVPISVNSSGTAIVVKTTFSGTSIAYKASATVEQVQ